MSDIVIDTQRCNKDGMCAASCPLSLIGIDEDTKIPYMHEELKDSCMECGHCISVCSQDALMLNDLKPEDCALIDSDLTANQEVVEQLLKSRRSIRKFKDKPVSQDEINKLIDMVNNSPTGMNAQGTSWRLINDKDKIQDLAEHVVEWMRQMSKVNEEYARYFSRPIAAWDEGVDTVLRSAPALAVAVAHSAIPAGLEDGVTAISQVELAAPSLGLGTCWAGFFYFAASSSKEIQGYISISEGEKCVGAVMLGYPQFKYRRIPQRKQANKVWV